MTTYTPPKYIAHLREQDRATMLRQRNALYDLVSRIARIEGPVESPCLGQVIKEARAVLAELAPEGGP